MRITETVPFTTIDLNAIVGQYFQQWMIFFLAQSSKDVFSVKKSAAYFVMLLLSKI